MKYTVIIRQPIPDNVRTNLEKELVERFGLNEQQAQRLAARRAGRLMKPTTQARAELLLSVFESVGAQVSLEEVREESDQPSRAFQAAAPSDDVELAPLLRNSASLSDLSATPSNDAFSGGVFTPTDDPFGPSAAVPSPFDAEFSSKAGGLVDPADLLPDWARQTPAAPDLNIPPDQSPEVNLLGLGAGAAGLGRAEKQLASELGAVAKPSTPTKPADDWADFAGGLNLPETSAAPDSTPRQTTEFLTAVTEETGGQNAPRTSLSNQIRWGTLLPLGLSGLLTLGLLGLSLPRLQQRLVQENAQTIASTLGLNLNTGSQSLANMQLDNTVKHSNIGFVQVELPDGISYLRAKNAAQNDVYAKQVADWIKTHPRGGTLNLGGQNYAVQRVSVIQDGSAQSMVTDTAGEQGGTVLRRVTVGLPTTTASGILRNTLLLVLLSTIIGLLIASLLAAQAARRIVQPISDLVKVADAISLGDLTRPVKVNSNDEIGDLAQALERMRLSLEAAMDRLRRRKRG